MLLRRVTDWPTGALRGPFEELERMRRQMDLLTGGLSHRLFRESTAGIFPLMNVTEDKKGSRGLPFGSSLNHILGLLMFRENQSLLPQFLFLIAALESVPVEHGKTRTVALRWRKVRSCACLSSQTSHNCNIPTNVILETRPG